MATAKDLIVKPIKSTAARLFIKENHYSGKFVNNSNLNFGVFLGGSLEGVMQFGPCLDKKKMQSLVSGSGWNNFIELNRMAFTDLLPKNSESRSIGIVMRLIKKNYPQIKWVVSFSDGTQCGDGTIYRASGFYLTGIKKSKNLVKLSDGSVIHKMTLESNPAKPRRELGGKTYYDITGGRYNFKEYIKAVEGEVLSGYQLRYIYFIDKEFRDRLTVPLIPFKRIDEMGAGMYKGVKVSLEDRRVKKEDFENPSKLGGAVPTNTLHNFGSTT